MPGHINVSGRLVSTGSSAENNSFDYPSDPKPALKTLETAQLRPQDVSKHVSTYADMFTSWLSAVNATKKRAYWQSVLYPS